MTSTGTSKLTPNLTPNYVN